MTARLQRSAGGVLLTLQGWSSHLFWGQPGHRLQLWSGRRPSDRSVCHRKAWWTPGLEKITIYFKKSKNRIFL